MMDVFTFLLIWIVVAYVITQFRVYEKINDFSMSPKVKKVFTISIKLIMIPMYFVGVPLAFFKWKK